MALRPSDKMFDYNNDGELDEFERSMKWGFYAQLAKKAAENDTDYSFRRQRNNSRIRSSAGAKTNRPDLVKKPRPEKTEEQKRKDKKRNTILFSVLMAAFLAFIIVAGVVTNSHNTQLEKYCIDRAQEFAQEYGLGFEKADIKKYTQLPDCYQADYYFSGMKNLSYDEMYQLAESLDGIKAPYGKDSRLVFMNLIYSDGDKYLIYTGTGINSIYLNGESVDHYIVDTEDNKNNSSSKNKSSNTSGTKKKSNSALASDNNPYNAKDYSNPEDFYDFYYYDFFDYYDAEKYWYAHHD